MSTGLTPRLSATALRAVPPDLLLGNTASPVGASPVGTPVSTGSSLGKSPRDVPTPGVAMGGERPMKLPRVITEADLPELRPPPARRIERADRAARRRQGARPAAPATLEGDSDGNSDESDSLQRMVQMRRNNSHQMLSSAANMGVAAPRRNSSYQMLSAAASSGNPAPLLTAAERATARCSPALAEADEPLADGWARAYARKARERRSTDSPSETSAVSASDSPSRPAPAATAAAGGAAAYAERADAAAIGADGADGDWDAAMCGHDGSMGRAARLHGKHSRSKLAARQRGYAVDRRSAQRSANR